MVDSWNSACLAPPDKRLYSYTVPELSELEKYKLNDISGIFEKICSNLEWNGRLKMDVALLDRMYYKIRCVFKADKQRRSISQVRCCFKRFYRMGLSSYCKGLQADIKKFMIDRPISSTIYLPSKEMFCHVLTRLQGLAKLLIKTIQYIEEAHYHVLQRVYMGHYKSVSMLLLAIFSRLWVLLRSLTFRVANWYSDLKPFVLMTKGMNKKKVNEDKFPESLTDWLTPDFQRFVSRTHLPSSLNERDHNNDSTDEEDYVLNGNDAEEDVDEEEEDDDKEEEDDDKEEEDNDKEEEDDKEEEESFNINKGLESTKETTTQLYVLSSDEEDEVLYMSDSKLITGNGNGLHGLSNGDEIQTIRISCDKVKSLEEKTGLVNDNCVTKEVEDAEQSADDEEEEMEISNAPGESNEIKKKADTKIKEKKKKKVNTKAIKIKKKVKKEALTIEKKANINKYKILHDMLKPMKDKKELAIFFKMEELNRSSNPNTCFSSKMHEKKFQWLKALVEEYVCSDKHPGGVERSVTVHIKKWMTKPFLFEIGASLTD